MSFEPRRRIPGLEPEAERALCEVQTAIARECKRIEKSAERPRRRRTELVEEGSVIAKPGEVVRVMPGDEDVTVVLPEPSPASDGEDIVISFEGDGTSAGKVQVVPANGTCLLPGVTTLNAPGSYRFTSTGGGATAKPRSSVVPASTAGPVPGAWSGPPAITTDDLPPIDTSELVDNSVDNSILDDMPGNSVKVNSSGASGDPTDLELPANSVLGRAGGDLVAIEIAENSVLGRAGAAGTGDIESITVPGTGTLTGEVVYLQSSSLRNHVRWSNIGLNSLPTMNDLKFVGNVSGAPSRPIYTDLAQLASDLFGIGFDTATHSWRLTDAVDNTFLGNITGATTHPRATPLSDIDSTSIIYVNVTKQFVRAALTGDVTAAQDDNATTIANNIVTNAKLRDSGALSVIGRAANSTGDPADISAVASSGAVLRESGSTLGFGTIATDGLADDSVTNAKLAEMAANTVKANATASTANPTDFAVGTNTVLGRVAGNIVAAQLVNAQITDGTIANAKLANMAARTVKGRQTDAATGVPVDLTGDELAENLRKNTIQTESSVSGALNITLNADTTVLLVRTTGDATIHSLSAGAGGGREIIIEHDRLSGTGNLTLAHNSGSATLQAFFLPNGQNVVLGQATCVVVRDRSTFWRANERGTSLADRDYGDVTVSAAGLTWTIDNDVVSDAKLRNSAALSVIGRSANSSGDPADIAATAASGAVLRESGSVLGFGTIATAGIGNSQVTNAKLANMAAGRVKGVQIDGATGDPQDLTGAEVGELIRYTTIVTDTTSSGVQTSYSLVTDIATMLRANTTSDVEIRGIAVPAVQGQRVVFHREPNSAGVWQFTHNSGGGTTQQQLFLMEERNVTLGEGSSLELEYTNNRWRQVGGSTLRHSTALSVIGRSANSTGDPADIAAANDGEVLRRSGTALGFGTIATAGLADNSATNAKLRDSGALSVIGRSANSSGDPADISATAASDAVLRESGSVLGFGTIATGGIANDAVTDAKLRNSGACSVIGRSANSSGDPADISAATNDRVLTRASDTLGFRQIANDMIADGTIALGKITGIGANTVIGNDTGSTTNPTTISVGTNTVLGRVGANIVAAQLATGQIADDAVTNAKLANMAQSTLKGRAAGAGTGDPTDLDLDTTVQRLIQVVRAFAADGSISVTPPAGATWFEGEMCGGGGGGGGADSETDGRATAGGGGGSGSYARLFGAIASGNITGSIGGGGAAGSAAGGDGGSGGDTVFAYNSSTSTAVGGSGGSGMTDTQGAGGGAVLTAASADGGDGGNATLVFYDIAFDGGAGSPSFAFGSGSDEGFAAARGGSGGASYFGGGGRGGRVSQAIGTANGQGGLANGSGGGGGARLVNATAAATGATGGAGAPGCMIIRFYSGPVPSTGNIS